MSLDVFLGHCSVRFDERDLRAVVPACVPYVAAALAWGWTLARDGAANHMDVIHGCKHLTDFRTAKQSQVGRAVFWRFAPGVQVIEGERFRVEPFIKRCREEKTFFRAMINHPKMPRKLYLLQDSMRTTCNRHFLVEEPEAHDRQLIVPIAGGPVDVIAELATDYEGGW